jgi:formamidase
MDWWTVVNRCRALENIAYVVAANQASSLKNFPPFSWPGASMIVDYDGRILAQAEPGPGEKIVVAPIDIDMLRYERAKRTGHQMLAHLRTEAYPVYRQPFYPAGQWTDEDLTPEKIEEVIEEVKRRLGYITDNE